MIFRLQYGNRFGDTAKVDITTPNGFGVLEIEGTGTPFKRSYKRDKSDKRGNFMTSSAEINIYETEKFNIDTLKTSSETDIRVTYYINDVKTWEGFVLPDFFTREIGGSGEVNMTATDRISTLKNVTLSDLPEMVSIRELCVLCLAKTGLDLPLKTMADFSAGGTNDFFKSKVLSQRFAEGNSGSISCYDVLGSICIASNSVLIQRNAEWYILNKLQHEIGTGNLYSSESEYEVWDETVHEFEEITKGAYRSIIPAASSVGVCHEFGGGLIHPANYNFAKDLSGWTRNGGFLASVDNKEIISFVKDASNNYVPNYGDATENKYLINYLNDVVEDSPNKFLSSDPIPIANFGTDSIKITLDINAIGINPPIAYDGLRPYAKDSFVAFALFVTNGEATFALNKMGVFEKLGGTYQNKDYVRRFDFLFEARGSTVQTLSKSISGVLSVGGRYIEDYELTLRIYGSGSDMVSIINRVFITFDKESSDSPKGNIYKTVLTGGDFTNTHEFETTIFGDYLTRGLNGYCYKYRTDDTSSLLDTDGNLRSKWTAPGDSESLPLLQHITRQKSRMFSVAHDLIGGELDVIKFDPLSIFRCPTGKRYVVVSAEDDFFRSSVNLELEEMAYG